MDGPELMQALKVKYPDASIEDILDKARYIGLERIFFEIRDVNFVTPVHIIEELCDRAMTCEDTITVMKLMAGYKKEFSDEINKMIDSHGVDAMYEFFQLEIISSNFHPSCCMRFRCTNRKKRIQQPPSGTSP